MLIKENKLERDSYDETCGPGCNSHISIDTQMRCAPSVYAQEHTGKHTHAHQLLICPLYRHADMLTHTYVNRNTPSLAHIQRTQTSPLTGCDYILERGNVLRLRWVDGGDMSALALNFTQDCLPISPCPFFTLREECLGGTLFHQNTLLTHPLGSKYQRWR